MTSARAHAADGGAASPLRERSRHAPRPKQRRPTLHRLQDPRRGRHRGAALDLDRALAGKRARRPPRRHAGRPAARAAAPDPGDRRHRLRQHRGPRGARAALVSVLVPVHSTSPKNGTIPKDAFEIDLEADTVTCPQGNTRPIYKPRRNRARATPAFGSPSSWNPTASPARCVSAAHPPAGGGSGSHAARTCARPGFGR